VLFVVFFFVFFFFFFFFFFFCFFFFFFFFWGGGVGGGGGFMDFLLGSIGFVSSKTWPSGKTEQPRNERRLSAVEVIFSYGVYSLR